MNQGQEAAVSACAYQLWEESGWVTDIIKNIGAKLNAKYSGDTYYV